MKEAPVLKKAILASWTPHVLALLGAFLYLVQAWHYARTTIPGLDEGSYLFKGYLYLHGVYEPFEPYGPLTNKAPFAFLIPGFAQYLFGAGLRTGRLFAIFLGLLAILGTWITIRRWTGKWFAAASVWVFALSPVVIKIHAITASEVIISCLLAWTCVLVLAEERPLWQVALGSVLSALAVLTRQNMVVVLPFLVLYIFWQHGWRKGVASLAAGGVVFLAVHAYYWPHILTIWAPWLPESLTPFLDPFRLPQDVVPVWNPSNDFWNRVIAFFQGIRYHFIPVVGGIFAPAFLVFRRDWKTSPAVRASLFLAALYLTLFAMHAWAAVASQYESYSCVYCFTPYLTFFDPLGIMAAAIALSLLWKDKMPRLMQGAAVILLLVIAAGVGLSSFDNVGAAILNFPVPRIRDGQFLPGSALLVDLISNKFGLELPLIKRYIASALGLGAGLAACLAALLLLNRARKDQSRPAFFLVLLSVFLVAGLALSPLLSMGGSRADCETDILVANEQVGAYLARVIPPDSLVYWEGGLSFTPMVYVPQARIFPPQINDGYSYRIGGDADTLYRFSHWNAELNEEWINTADIFIVESRRYAGWKGFLIPQEFEEYQRPPAAPSCEEGAGLRIFHRLP
jgi:4-amino-4-deoxy-L-arabinose transferase-like glycosyltransferase